MILSAPKFWQHPSHCAGKILAPLGAIYGAIAKHRMKSATPKEIEVPVICVGNLVLGGAGKTPTAIALNELLQGMGKESHFLTRGYGGTEQGPVRVNAQEHNVHQVGDEPFLLAQNAPTWVSKKRVEGAKKAIESGAEVIIMDDGHQNPELKKDLSLIVVEGGYGFGNEKVFPAGPLREFVQQGLQRADAIVIIGECKHGVIDRFPPNMPVFQAYIRPYTDDLNLLRSKQLIAFAGLGNPDKFFICLKENCLDIKETVAFSDHHPYRPQEIKKLLDAANAQGCELVTTAKDFVKIPVEYRSRVNVLRIRAEFTETKELGDLIQNRCSSKERTLCP